MLGTLKCNILIYIYDSVLQQSFPSFQGPSCSCPSALSEGSKIGFATNANLRTEPAETERADSTSRGTISAIRARSHALEGPYGPSAQASETVTILSLQLSTSLPESVIQVRVTVLCHGVTGIFPSPG